MINAHTAKQIGAPRAKSWLDSVSGDTVTDNQRIRETAGWNDLDFQESGLDLDSGLSRLFGANPRRAARAGAAQPNGAGADTAGLALSPNFRGPAFERLFEATKGEGARRNLGEALQSRKMPPAQRADAIARALADAPDTAREDRVAIQTTIARARRLGDDKIKFADSTAREFFDRADALAANGDLQRAQAAGLETTLPRRFREATARVLRRADAIERAIIEQYGGGDLRLARGGAGDAGGDAGGGLARPDPIDPKTAGRRRAARG